MTMFKDIFLLLRISHWSKAAFVLVGVFYAKAWSLFGSALVAALAFCFVSSAVYIYNDIQDRFEDSKHPHKCRRPLAKETISLRLALFFLFSLLIIGLAMGWLISRELALILSCYIVINLLYNHYLRLLPVLDVSAIALGFLLRVLAGTIGIGLPVSWWLTITITLLSFFIALGKRRLELQLDLQSMGRKVLEKYNIAVLNTLIIVSGVGCFISYLLYTIYAKDESFYFISTLPFAAIALWRFAWLTRVKKDNDDPVIVFLRDNISLLNMLCFIVLTYMALRQ